MSRLLGPRAPWLRVPEEMDRPDVAGPDLDLALADLADIHDHFGGHRCAWRGLNRVWAHGTRVAGRVRLLDVGCGGGELVRTATDWAARRGLELRLTLVDFNRQVCRSVADRYREVYVVQCNMMSMSFADQAFDAVHCGLVLHHLGQADGARLLRGLAQLSRRAVIVSDLHRHPVPYLATAIGSRLLSRSHMVRLDGPLSVRRGFTRSDLEALADRAGLRWASLRRVWPFRWLGVLRTDRA